MSDLSAQATQKRLFRRQVLIVLWKKDQNCGIIHISHLLIQLQMNAVAM